MWSRKTVGMRCSGRVERSDGARLDAATRRDVIVASYYWLKDEPSVPPALMANGGIGTERYFRGVLSSTGRFSGFHAIGVGWETRAMGWIDGVILATPDAPWEVYEHWGMPGSGRDRLVETGAVVELVVMGPVRAVAVRMM